jgi:catechol 2,3-dioxygenase-like lactoylglutathione lyase family enzyme
MGINVRYIVNNVEDAMAFYTEKLGFTVDMHPAPGFAALSKDNLKLFLNQPGAGGAGQTMKDGAIPSPGGWNRFQLEIDDLENFVKELKGKEASFRSEIITGQGGKQALLQDPSGNLIELFEPKK